MGVAKKYFLMVTNMKVITKKAKNMDQADMNGNQALFKKENKERI